MPSSTKTDNDISACTSFIYTLKNGYGRGGRAIDRYHSGMIVDLARVTLFINEKKETLFRVSFRRGVVVVNHRTMVIYGFDKKQHERLKPQTFGGVTLASGPEPTTGYGGTKNWPPYLCHGREKKGPELGPKLGDLLPGGGVGLLDLTGATD